jgi:hypothetical protein
VPTPVPTPVLFPAADSTQWPSLVLWLAGFGLVFGVVLACRRLRLYCGSNFPRGGPAYLRLPFLPLDDASRSESSPESIELVLHNIMKAHEFPPGMYIVVLRSGFVI